MKLLDQERLDRNRQTYRLSFPSNLKPDDVIAWVRSISGTLRSHSLRFSGSPTVAFEMWATSTGIEHRIKVPWSYVDYIVPQLRQQGLRVTPEDEFPRRVWTRAVEVGLTHSSRQLRIFEPEHTSATLLAAVQALQEGETIVMQIVVTPAVPKHLPVHKEASTEQVSAKALVNGNTANKDEVNDRRAKLGEPNFLATMRIGATAPTVVRADHLIYRVRAALASNRSAAVRFNKRLVKLGTLQRRIDNTAGSLTYSMQLNALELAALISWPIGNPNISGLPPYMATHMPASDVVPREGRIIGRSNFPGSERYIAQGYTEALKHTHVAGPTGVGKSSLLANLAKQDMEHGFGLIVLESKGDLFHRVLDYVPPERLDDVIVMDVTDSRWPIGFNILEQGTPAVVIDELCGLFNYLYRDTRGVWTQEALYHGLRTLVSDSSSTFIDLPALLIPNADEVEWSDNMRRQARDPELRLFWQRLENQPKSQQDRFMQPILDRIWQLTARPKLRYILGQSQSSFLMSDVIMQNKILLINLESLEQETASLCGTLIMNAVWHAVKTNRPAKPNFLYLDEFQDFLNLPISADDMLAKARGFGMGMTLAHQNFGQLPPDIRSAVLNNARTKIYYQTSADDARIMAREFKPLDENDFQHFRQFEGAARIATGEGVSAPLTFRASDPAKGYNTAEAARTASRQRYGREISTVARELEQRHQTAPTPAPSNRRPKIGVWMDDDTDVSTEKAKG